MTMMSRSSGLSLTMTMSDMIIAFDPGVTTGVAWIENGEFHATQWTEHEVYEHVDEWCDRFEHVRIESFIINAATIRKTVVYDSLYLIGYLRYAAWRCGFETSFTKPADVMASFPDAALKRAKMHTPGQGHANDAARHLAHYLVKSGAVKASVFLPK
jgi:hypothetical protein